MAVKRKKLEKKIMSTYPPRESRIIAQRWLKEYGSYGKALKAIKRMRLFDEWPFMK